MPKLNVIATTGLHIGIDIASYMYVASSLHFDHY